MAAAAGLGIPESAPRGVRGDPASSSVAGTLEEAFDRADESFPGFRERVLDGQGEIKRFINVFVNGVDVRTLQGRATPVHDSDEVAVIPAMAGGTFHS